MKIGIGADTGDFDKGAKKVKQEMKDLSKVSNDAFSSIGNAIGVDTGKLTQFSSALQGLGNKLQQTGNAGAQAFGSILTAIGPVATGIAGLGIGAAVTAFKALKSEAEAFGNTIDGLNLKLSTQAYIDTYRQALHDANSETGKSVGEVMAEWQKSWARFKSNVSGTFVQWIAGEDTVGLGEAWRKVSASIDEATAAAERNEQRGNQLAEVMKRELEVRKEVADIDVKIAEQRRIIRDRSGDVEARTKAEAELRQLIADKTQKQTAISEELYHLHEAMAAETGSSYEEMQKVVSLYESWKGQIASASDQLAAVDRYANSIKQSTDKELENRRKIQELMKNGGGIQAVESGSTIGNQITGIKVPATLAVAPDKIQEFKSHIVEELGGGITVAIAIDPDSVQKIHDITNEINSMVENMATSVGEALGKLAANLINGEDPWGQFASAALSAIGDMAVSVGKMAIATGVATLGIKAALESLNGYVAIAAGIALVALGTAVKAGLANVASGNYSASTNVATNTTSSITNGYEEREIYVHVEGALRADGNQLLAVINQTEKKNWSTT